MFNITRIPAKDASAPKKGFSIEINKNVKKAEDVIKKETDFIKKDINIVKGDIKKIELENPEAFDFFVTYGWAIIIIILCICGFMWWQYFSVRNESCEFLEGSGLLCENFDITNESLSFEIRNLNNKTITINQLTMVSCFINPDQQISENDKKRFNIPCNISSGKLKEKLVVAYKHDEFQKHVVAKLSKIVP